MSRTAISGVLTALLVWMAAVAESSAVEPRGLTLSLEDCIHSALEAGPQRDLIVADLKAAKARLDEAKAGRFGTAEYTQIVGVVNEARGDPVYSPDKQTDFFNGLGPFTRLELDVRLPIYTFGKLSAALEAAEKGLSSERARGEVTEARTVLETKRLYYGLLLSQQLTYVLQDMLDSMDEAIELTEQRLDDDSHQVTELDVLRLKVGRSKFVAGVERVEAATRLTKSALARTIGLDPTTKFEISDRRLRPVPFEPGALESYLDTGPRSRPEWKQITRGIEAQEAVVDLEEANFLPTVFLGTGVRYAVAGNRDDQENVFANDDFNYLQPFGVLGLHWNLSYFTNEAKAAQARAQHEKLLAERRSAETGLRLEVEKAFVSVEEAQAKIDATAAGRKAARGLLILTVTNYDIGIGDGKDLFEAFGLYTETSTDYFRAVHDYNVAVADLSRAVGSELLDLDY